MIKLMRNHKTLIKEAAAEVFDQRVLYLRNWAHKLALSSPFSVAKHKGHLAL